MFKRKADDASRDFSTAEQGAIAERTLENSAATSVMDQAFDRNKISGDPVEHALLWPLSAAEAGVLSASLRPCYVGAYKDSWWLRSPGLNPQQAAYVSTDTDGIKQFGENVCQGPWFAYRFAFFLNQDKVLFTSDTVNGKASGGEGADALVENTTSSVGPWKLTIKDDAHANFAISECSATKDGVSVTYKGAATGSKEYVSAIIQNSSGDITYYGRIKNCTGSGDASGTVTINTTGKLSDGDTLYVFNEQMNGATPPSPALDTDYASALQKVVPTKKYTVTFVDGQGKTLKTEQVESGKAATAPSDPTRDGYMFKGWDKDFSKVTANMTVTAQWKKASGTAAKAGGVLLAKITAKGRDGLVISWNGYEGAEGYDVFMVKCSGDAKFKKVKSVKAGAKLKWTKKGLKRGIAYKAYVKAYVMKDGKRSYLKKSPVVHAYTSGGTKSHTNAKSVTVAKTKVSLKVGKVYKVTANVTVLQKGKKLMSKEHAPKLRYLSSNTKVAKVSSSGKITAKGKGTCKVYAYAVNGAKKAITVTVV